MGTQPRIPAAPPLATKWAKYVVGFGVSVAVGLAPYLGRLNVPLFTPLLNLIPPSVQDTAIPLSAALMGIVAVLIEWYGMSTLTLDTVQKWFSRTVLWIIAGFILLTIIQTRVVARVSMSGGKETASFLVGLHDPLTPPCERLGKAECIKLITTDPAKIESHWGDDNIANAKLALLFSYLAFTSGFGFLVGLLVLRQGMTTPTPKKKT
jgi:ABC-type antimicrobial peptide transport system permease subunit